MIAEGLVELIQTGITGQFTPLPGGFGIALPKDYISSVRPKGWAWRTIASTPTITTQGRTSFTAWRVQIDCHGYTAPDAILLAAAIDGVLRQGFSGALADPDSTKVDSIYNLPGCVDGYSDINRTFVRSQEYLVQFYQS